uniref:N-acetyltransferase domain-containing protein n=1 Tax=termite gut metagenome TaxID=433724 RepID=S0DDX1_9ZZZZ
MKYTLEEVTSKAAVREFLDLPKRLYRGNRNWVCPLDSDIEGVFDPVKNKKFADGEAVRWIARDESGKVCGRIAAFYNREDAAIEEQPTGGLGFFEAVHDQALADLLFDTAREWLADKGMEAMDGPVNFGSRDAWWGLLVEGFEFQPLYTNPYNPPYYIELFENYGFRNYFNQYTYNRKMKTGALNQSVYERVKRLEESPGYRFEHIDIRNLPQVAEDFRLIYNKAWAHHSGVKPMEKEDAEKMMKSMKPIIDERLIYFAYFNDEPIGFFIMVPDLNRVIGRFHGKLGLFNKIRLWAMLKLTRKADRIFAIIFGVSPEFHGKGIESGIIHRFEQEVDKGMPYNSLELAWVGDFNPIMMRMVENYVCATKHKTHVTYRYLFDRDKEFKRAPRIGVKKA